jgi:hypothetical protein
MAEKLFGAAEHPREWLNTPSGDFEGNSPLDYAEF